MTYKEKKFTKVQIRKIQKITQLLIELRVDTVEVYASENSLTFYRGENLKFAQDNEGLFGKGSPIDHMSAEIDGISKDDYYRYSKDIRLTP